MLLCSVATLRRQTRSRPCTEVTIGTPRLCIVLNTRGVLSDEVKDKVFHALANLGIPLSDRQESVFLSVSRVRKPVRLAGEDCDALKNWPS